MSETTPPSPATPTTATASGAPTAPTISIDDFLKLDLRVATIRTAEFHPNADKLLKLQLDDGTPQGRQVCAGIRQWYDPATLVGRQVVIVANLAPRTIRGEVSQGMVLAASDLKDAAIAPASAAAGAAVPSAAASAGIAGVASAARIAAAPSVERDVVVLMPDRPVKPGSKVS